MTAQGFTGPNVAIADVSGLQDELDSLAADILANSGLIATNAANIAGNAASILRTRGAFMGASDYGFQAWTAEPLAGQAGTVVPTAGLSHIIRVRTSDVANLATNLVIHVTVGGSALTAGQCFATLHSDAGVILSATAVTADQSTSWASGGLKTMALTGTQALTPNTWYKIRLWFNGTTGPTLTRAINSSTAITNAGLSAPNFRFATADSGLTTAALAPGTIGAMTGTATAWWAAIS